MTADLHTRHRTSPAPVERPPYHALRPPTGRPHRPGYPTLSAVLATVLVGSGAWAAVVLLILWAA